MSHVTDILLLTAIGEPGASTINSWLIQNHFPELVPIRDYAGGNKVMQCEIYAAAINGFDIDGFVAAAAAVSWESPECVQLLIKDEHDERFTLHDL